MNAVDSATEHELEQIWSDIEADQSVRCVVLTGSGEKAFSAGADLKSESELSGVEYWASLSSNGFGGIAMRRSLSVPVIARVNGLALGGGMEMVLGCDIVIAAENASFGLPEARVGRMPLDGGMIVLPRMIPQKIAMGMLLTGNRISAQDAATHGLVNEVVAADDLDDAVDRWIAQILKCAPLSVKAIKECVKETSDLSIDEAQSKRLPSLIAALESEDSDEGPRAFREKREPDWKGR
jgi:crotonobetainyl-CoA hydratase